MTQIAEPISLSSPAVAVETPEEPDLDTGLASLFPLVLRLPDSLRIDGEQFLAFCRENQPLRIERNATGELEIMPPAGDDAPVKNSELTYQLTHWAKADGTGRAFDSSAGFTFPNGAERGPDAAWAPLERLSILTPAQRRPFPQLCPDFVVELRSSSDRLTVLKKKMEEYLANGARLGWLIDPRNRRIFIYRPDQPFEQLDNPATVSGDPVLPGFVLDVQAIFDASF